MALGLRLQFYRDMNNLPGWNVDLYRLAGQGCCGLNISNHYPHTEIAHGFRLGGHWGIGSFNFIDREGAVWWVFEDDRSRNRGFGILRENNLRGGHGDGGWDEHKYAYLYLLSGGVICLQRDLVPILAGFISVLQIGCDLIRVFIGKFVPVFLIYGSWEKWLVRGREKADRGDMSTVMEIEKAIDQFG